MTTITARRERSVDRIWRALDMGLHRLNATACWAYLEGAFLPPVATRWPPRTAVPVTPYSLRTAILGYIYETLGNVSMGRCEAAVLTDRISPRALVQIEERLLRGMGGMGWRSASSDCVRRREKGESDEQDVMPRRSGGRREAPLPRV